MQSVAIDLICHPDTPQSAVKRLAVQCDYDDGLKEFVFIFMVSGHIDQLFIPSASKPYRADELWRTTCFEIFRKTEDEAYVEFNLSPSGQWAAYAFDRYREGMSDLPIEHPVVHPPTITMWDETFEGESGLGASCTIGMCNLPGRWFTRFALSAVIEETSGTKSYWAIRHPPGPPDFHHPDCFALTLGAPDGS
jgi:hypothetical protein